MPDKTIKYNGKEYADNLDGSCLLSTAIYYDAGRLQSLSDALVDVIGDSLQRSVVLSEMREIMARLEHLPID